MTAQTAKLQFKPGIVKDESPLANEPGYIDMDKGRFRMGKFEPIGGWEAASRPAESFTNPARGAHAWAALTGDRVMAFGTSNKLHSFYGGTIGDITPAKYRGTLTDPFTTTNGSATVLVTHADHGLKIDDSVTYALADAAGGITVTGAYTVVRVLSIDTYEITHGSNATSSATGGGKVEVTATLDDGLIDGLGGSGWGTGTYSTGYYGYPTGGDINPRVWSMDNWGNNLVAVPRNGALYEWQPSGAYTEVVTTGDFASGTGWTAGAGWSIGAGVATAVAGSASDLEQTITSLISGGLVYVAVFTVTRTAGSVQFEVTSADIGDVAQGEAISKAGTYTRYFRAPSNPTKIKFNKDASFAGTIDNVSIKLASLAYRIQSAPQYSIGGFVDPSRIMVLYGTIEADGDYNPLLVRWCNQEDLTTWIPDDDNLAGEYGLARGSRCVGGLAGRGQNLIWTDDALYTMRFTGSSGDVFRFDLAGSGCGLAGKNAAAEHNGWVFWWGANNQFYVYRGGEPQIIECPLRRSVVESLAASQQEKIFCGINAEFNEVWWFYADDSISDECNSVIIFNWVENHWSCGTFDRSAWVRGGVFPHPIGFGTDGILYYHERGRTANGSTIAWNVKTSDFDIEDGGNMMAVTRYHPDFDDQDGPVNLTLYFKQSPNGSVRTAGPYSLTTSTERVNFRHVARQMAMKWSAGTNNLFARIGTIRLDIEKTGMKR